MKSTNLPKNLFILLFSVFTISLLGAFIIGSISLIIVYYFGLIISPISVLLLITWKLRSRKIQNTYFYISLVLNIILFSISLYATLHMFDNFMSLG